MANKKISELPAGGAVGNADKFPAVESGSAVTVYKTAQQLKAFIGTGTVTATTIATTGGTPSASTFLRGDNTWATPAGGGGGGTGGAVVSGNASTFDTMADLQAATIQTGVNTVRTMGYWTIGDIGGAAYRRKASGDPDYELDRTSNGGTVKWELIPEGFEIWFPQTGAKTMIIFDHQDVDAYPGWRAADKFAKAKGLAGYALRFPSGFWFFSKAIHLKRIATKIIGTAGGSAGGAGTMLRFPKDQSGIITNYKWGAGHDYSIAIPNFGINAGGGNYVSSDQPNAGDVYRCVTAGTSGAGGAADLVGHTDPNVTFTWGTAVMRYEGNIVTQSVPGGGTMDYDVGGDDNSSAQDCVIENINLWGFFDPRAVASTTSTAYGLWKYNNAGIVMRVRARVSNVWTLSFPGHGVAIVADGDIDLKGPGNVNGWYLTHVSSYYNGKDGIHVGYSDANAGSAYQIDVAQNNRWGIADWCFLTNLWCGVQSAYDGRGYPNTRQYYPQCQYQGWIYMSSLPILGSTDWPTYINEQPDTHPVAWIRYYKCFPDLPNTEMLISNTKTDNSIELGAATSGNITADASGLVAGDNVWYLVTDGARYEYNSGPYYPAGYNASTPNPTLLRAQPLGQGYAQGAYASSTTQANGAPGLLPALSGSAKVKILAKSQDYENAPYWNQYTRFEPAGAFSTNNLNARTIWLGPYIEGGTLPAQWCFPTLVLGGIMGDAYDETRGATIFTENRFRTISTQTQIQANDGTFPKFRVTLNSSDAGGDGIVMSWTDFNGQNYALRQENTGTGSSGYGSGDLVLDYVGAGVGNGGNPLMRFRTGGAQNFGRATAGDWVNERATHITSFVLGDRGATNGRAMWMGTGPPTTGHHAVGERVFNIAPTAGGTDGWVCTTAGTPGTWKIFGAVSA